MTFVKRALCVERTFKKFENEPESKESKESKE